MLGIASAYESIAATGTIEPDDGPGLNESFACYQRSTEFLSRAVAALGDMTNDPAGTSGERVVYDVLLTAVGDYGDRLDLHLNELGYRGGEGHRLAERVRHIAPEVVATEVSQEEAIELKKTLQRARGHGSDT